MSTTYSAALASILVTVLPLLGINVGTAELTQTIQTLVVILSGLWVMVERVRRGDVNLFGFRK